MESDNKESNIRDQIGPNDIHSVNTIGAGGVQGGNFFNSTLSNPTFIINGGLPEQQIDVSTVFAKFKEWVLNENSLPSKKIKQLDFNGEICHIKRTLSLDGDNFPEDELLIKIPCFKTSLVTGPAGSGKSTLAASIIVNWAKSEESSYSLVLFLSSLHKMGNLPLHKQLWGEYAGHISEDDSSRIYQKLLSMKEKILVIIDGLGKKAPKAKDSSSKVLKYFLADEFQLSTELTEESNNAAALPSKDVSRKSMIFGILTNGILPGATVLGFTRSGKVMNKEFLAKKSKVYTLLDVDIDDYDDMEGMIQKHTKDPEQIKIVFRNIKKIGLNQIIFLMKILEHQGEDLGEITTASDIFLMILRGNLAHQGQQSDTPFSELLKDEEKKDFMKRIFELCKENLQGQSDDTLTQGIYKLFKINTQKPKDSTEKQDGVFNGTIMDKENWVSDSSGITIPLEFLKSVGLFEVPPPWYDTLTLSAQHLSFVEFLAAVGIILCSNVKEELKKIDNRDRLKAVVTYIRDFS